MAGRASRCSPRRWVQVLRRSWGRRGHAILSFADNGPACMPCCLIAALNAFLPPWPAGAAGRRRHTLCLHQRSLFGAGCGCGAHARRSGGVRGGVLGQHRAAGPELHGGCRWARGRGREASLRWQWTRGRCPAGLALAARRMGAMVRCPGLRFQGCRSIDRGLPRRGKQLSCWTGLWLVWLLPGRSTQLSPSGSGACNTVGPFNP